MSIYHNIDKTMMTVHLTNDFRNNIAILLSIHKILSWMTVIHVISSAMLFLLIAYVNFCHVHFIHLRSFLLFDIFDAMAHSSSYRCLLFSQTS